MFKNIRFKKISLATGGARAQSGQSTVEYIILVTAVLGVIILFMTGNNNLFQSKINSTLGETANQMKDKGSELADSHNTPLVNESSSKVSVDPLSNLFN